MTEYAKYYMKMSKDYSFLKPIIISQKKGKRKKDEGAKGKKEHKYKIIAKKIRKERRRLGITQAELAERADVSLDTIKSVENGRRAMSLDTYLNIVHALESSPMVLMSQQHPEKHIERFAFMMNRCDEREIEFALHMIEQILRGQEDYLSE